MVFNNCFLEKKELKYYDSYDGLVSEADLNKHVFGVVRCMGDLLKQHGLPGVPKDWMTNDVSKFRAECYQQPNGKVVCIIHVINVSLICL